jgi:hypothetical protein
MLGPGGDKTADELKDAEIGRLVVFFKVAVIG